MPTASPSRKNRKCMPSGFLSLHAKQGGLSAGSGMRTRMRCSVAMDRASDKEGGMSAAKMLEIIARYKKPLSEIVAELPRYQLYKAKTECPDERKQDVLDELAKRMADKEVITLDGVKVLYPDGWVLIRPSGTEPIFRVYAEAKELSRAKELADEAMGVVKGIIG